ncbi:hypothetical protein AB0M92_22215 [Streptomyces sp. NPDC051582]|uniref:hypothetical protein n=1 Tax=Streptomyces sp. NPDC051582 TaxID=3155167 RepID=UPI00341F35E6
MQPALVERDAVAPLVAAQPADALRGACGAKISPQRIHELRTFRGNLADRPVHGFQALAVEQVMRGAELDGAAS